MVYAAFGATLLAICAQTVLPAAIPFTGQTFAAALIGAVFGVKRGVCSALLYVALGAAGIPVFSGMRGGIPIVLGATGGYILGLVPFTAVTAFFRRRLGGSFVGIYVSMLLGLCVCYAFGTAWYAAAYAGKDAADVLMYCVIPFVIPDLIKLALAAVLAKKLAAAKRVG